MRSILLSILLVTVTAIVTWALTMQQRLDTPSARDLTERSYIELCSGLEPKSEQTYLLAQANCLGRIRGYADSHQQTVKLLQNQYAISKQSQLWCVPRTVNDKELLTTVLDWIDSHPSEHEALLTSYSGTTGAIAILAAALRSTYPCSR